MISRILRRTDRARLSGIRGLLRSLSLRDSFPSAHGDEADDSVNTFRARLIWLSWIRLAMLVTLVFSTLVFSIGGESSMLDSVRGFLLWFTILSLVPSSLYFPILLAVRSQTAIRSIAVLQIIQDSAFAAVMVTSTGGTGSGFTFFFPLMIIIAGLVLQRTGTVIGIMISALFLLIIACWETGLMVPPVIIGELLNPGKFENVFYAYAFNLIAFFVVGVLSNFLMSQIRKSDIQKEAYRIDLADLRVLHETIISSLDTGLVTISLEGSVVHLNRAAQQLLDVDLKVVRGQQVDSLIPELPGPIEEIDGEIDIARVGEDDETRYFLIVIKPLLSSRWKMVGRLIRIEDVTDIRRMEEQRKADERLATIGKLAAVVAHEIRNPLAAISASAQMVAMSEDVKSEDRRALEIVVKETDHLNMWITDLLDYARPRKGEATEFDLSEMISHNVQLAMGLSGAERINFVSDIQPQVVIQGDSQRFGRVVLNILKNAVEAIGTTGNIVVRLFPGISRNFESVDGSPPPPVSVLTIWNDGPVIPQENQERIFETFYTTKARGTGLGLSTVVQICADYGARVSVTSNEAEGTEFRIEFPL